MRENYAEFQECFHVEERMKLEFASDLTFALAAYVSFS